MLCPECGNDLVAIKSPFEFAIYSDTVIINDVSRLQCLKCSEMFFEFEEMGYLQRKANILYREKNGYLTGDEIKAIRSKYRYSQEVFEALIRSGKKSLTRWENNSALQTGPVDTLLRLIDCFPFVVRWLENPECFYRYSSPYTVGGEIENSFEIQRPVGTRTELEKELVA